jgi:hypothetical protein
VARLQVQIDDSVRRGRHFRLCLLSLAAVAALLPIPAHSGQYSARVSWAPSASGNVVEYDVYRRPVSGSYGAPEAGTPTSSGGVLSLVVTKLDVRTDYAFSVKAVGTTGTSVSNEMLIGYADVAPLVDSDGDGLTEAEEDLNLNRTVDAGESNPDLTDSDADGVGDLADACEGTAAGSSISAVGCACAQISCGNGNVCDGVETCSAGVCRPDTAPSCDDGNACTADTCDPATGCRSTAIACPGCRSNADCNDGNACNGVESCRRGVCQAGTPLVCADANPCTTDTCEAARGCVYPPAGDGTPCGPGDSYCAGMDACFAGACRPGTPPSCDDGNTCSIDSCDDALGRCVHQSRIGCCRSDADCADTDACTTQERCVQGSCVSTPLACPAAGACAVSQCDATEGCLTVPQPDGTSCDDGDACSVGDACTSGQCVTTAARTCPDPGPCAVGRCDTARGCVADPLPDGTPCDDGNRCTKNDSCRAGVCGKRIGRADASPSFGTEPSFEESVPTVERFSLRSVGQSGRLRGRARLSGGDALLPLTDDLVLTIGDGAGGVLYHGELPADALVTKLTRKGGRIRLRRDTDPRLRRLVVRISGSRTRLAFTLVGESLPQPDPAAALTLKVRGGCGRS